MTDTSAPSPNPYPVAPVASRGGSTGRIALILAIVLVGFGVVVQVLSYAAAPIAYDLALGAAQMGMFFGATNIVGGLLAVVVVVLGALGVQPSQASGRLSAAAALAIGASHVLATIVGLLAPLVLSVVL